MRRQRSNSQTLKRHWATDTARFSFVRPDRQFGSIWHNFEIYHRYWRQVFE